MIDEAAWLAEVTRVLRGAPIEKLTGQMLDGPAIRPLYWREGGPPPLPLPLQPGGQSAASLGFGWTILQRHDLADPILANRAILEDLANGVSGIVLKIDNAFARGGERPDGVVILERRDLEATLDEVMLDLVPLAIDAGPRALEIGAMLVELASHTRRPVGLALGIDPIGCFAQGLCDADAATTDEAVALAKLAGPAVRTFRADGRRWHDAGSSEAQELAFTLATALHYLRALDAAGLPPELGEKAIELTLVADDDLLATTAKLRAARLLWGRILAASGVAAPVVEIRAQTAWRMLTRHSAHLNILRATVATFAAACAGADRVTVLPFDAAIGVGDGFSRRIARNVQIVLAEESNIFRTLDPAAGSFAIERLTMEMAALACAKLQALEAQGGIVETLRAGGPQAAIAAVAAERAKLVATRRQPVTGVSEFPELDAPPPRQLPDMTSFLVEAKQRRGTPQAPPSPTITPLRPHRLAEPYERLRDRAAAFRTRSGAWPRLFLATIGDPAEYTERANWAQNLLAAGGIEVMLLGTLADAVAAAAAFQKSGTQLAALCASDQAYSAHAEHVARALRAAGAIGIYLIGRPGAELEASLRAAGIDDFADQGIDVPAWLEAVQVRLGITGRDGA